MLLSAANATAQPEAAPVRLADGRDGYVARVSAYRQDGVTHALVSLAAAKAERPVAGEDSNLRLLRILNRIPDAFVVTDEALDIVEANLAFLELAQLASVEAAKGQPLSRFLGRPGVDLKVLMGNLREYGSVRNFGTITHTSYGSQEEVVLSAVSVRVGLETSHAFVIRPSRRPMPAPAAQSDVLPRTPDQLRQLVGRVSLREIVAETTDVIERMCIEAALNLTGNNRASAAEVLGLSRQSLYSKLNRHGVSTPEQDPAPET
jgi:transcriptional regulator PpsR